MGRFHANSLAPEILHIHFLGMTRREIAEKTDCSIVNVAKTLARHLGKERKVLIDPLPEEQRLWLISEAKKSRITEAVLARAMLLDAIEDARAASETPKRGAEP